MLFQNGIQLIDTHLERQRQNSSESITLSVVWQVTEPLAEPAQLTLDVRDSNDQTITAYNPGNADRYSRLVQAWQVGQPPPSDAEPKLARIAGLGDLVGIQISGDDVVFTWQATAEPISNVTLFMHGLDANGKIIAQ